MTLKLILLKSGEDVICDIREISQEGETKVLGYQLIQPYSVWISEGMSAEDDDGNIHKLSNPEITMEPYAPLAKEQHIPVVADWVVSIMEPIDDLLDMYTTSIQDYERKRKASSDGEAESPDSD